MERVLLGTGLLRRGETVLLVRCRYAGQPEPLWTLPGGRQEAGELLTQTVRREFREETSLDVTPGELSYVSESVDPMLGTHVLNCTFWMRETEAAIQPRPADPRVLEARFVPVQDAPDLLRADVLRIPVAAALGGTLTTRYFSFQPDDIVVPFFKAAKRR